MGTLQAGQTIQLIGRGVNGYGCFARPNTPGQHSLYIGAVVDFHQVRHHLPIDLTFGVKIVGAFDEGLYVYRAVRLMCRELLLLILQRE